MTPPKAKRARTSPTDQAATGTYRYDKATGQVVRVSDRVPKVSSKGKKSSPSLPCGRSGPCGGGRCPS
ncbi:MAG: hypothetical protein COV48_05485 [Elusimicrobia bacterium CG11_big_fil_rev_8_21_14_0_20_64_6]|nr:MAG: hypothetical protein COV48_05485 [Elusimicrobia bacterium CG11_big_fil_rev_8_21_14_0_20_64_6]